MKAIITGAAGFVGSNLVKKLNEKNISDIVIIDNFDEKKLHNIRDLQFTDYIDYSDGIDKVNSYLKMANKPDVFFHIGANSDVLEDDAKKMMYQNFEFSKMYCAYCAAHNIPFIYASSSAVYGNSRSFTIAPENENPHNIYAWSKWLFDKYISAHLPYFTNKVIGYRFFNVFGMREFHKGKNACIANRFVGFMKEKGFIDLFDTKIERDYVWAEDLAEIFYQTYSKEMKNGIYNLGGGNPISHKEIAEMVVDNFIESGKKNGERSDFIKLVPMPEELKQKFQFYTFADDLLPFISNITTNNKAKLNRYVKELIQLENEQ